MSRWNKPIRMTAEHLLRNLEPTLDGLGPEYSVDRPTPSYSEVAGWHFYAKLWLSPELEKHPDTVNEEAMVSQIYHRYTMAAKRVTDVFEHNGYSGKVELLEHQGLLLHFHLPFAITDILLVKAFGHMLATLVDEYVFKFEHGKACRFAMAAEWGDCFVLRVPAPSGEWSAYSRVSIGPCANNPAKKLLGIDPPLNGHLVYRTAGGGIWVDEECVADEESREVIRSFSLANKSASYALDVIAEEGLAVVPDVSVENPVKCYGYTFRADLDGFTKKVAEVFSAGRKDEAYHLVEAFIGFMESVGDWQRDRTDGVKIIALPWAGDCCNMIAYPLAVNEENNVELSREQISTFPMKIVKSWEGNITKEHRDSGLGDWAYGVSLGRVRIFTENVEGTSYRLTVGWPIAVSHAGVNILGTQKGDLVMHKDEINLMNAVSRKTFAKLTPNYSRQGKVARDEWLLECVSDAGKRARTCVFAGESVPVTRPHFPL